MPADSPGTTIAVSTDYYCFACRFSRYDYCCEFSACYCRASRFSRYNNCYKYSLLLPCQQVLPLRLLLCVQLFTVVPAGSPVATIAISSVLIIAMPAVSPVATTIAVSTGADLI